MEFIIKHIRIIAIIAVVITAGFIVIRREWQKTLILPGNQVAYHGRPEIVGAMELDTRSGKATVQLLKSRQIVSADSVQNVYRPFWKF